MMDTDMKFAQKINITILLAGTYLASAFPTFAISLCPGNIQGVCQTEFTVNKLVGDILTYLFVGAAIIAIIYLIWGGIKWITSSGDKAKVEAARGTIIGAIIGLVIVFASYFIITLVLDTIFHVQLNNISLPSLSGTSSTQGNAE